MRRVRSAITGLLLALALAAIFHVPLLSSCGRVMTVDDRLEPVDVLVPFAHHPKALAATAELYRNGIAPRVLVPRMQLDRAEALGLAPPRHVQWRQLLERFGVAADVIEDTAIEAVDERDVGRALAAEAAGRPLRVLVVASPPASRIVRNGLRRGVGSAPVIIRMHVVRVGPDETNWWRSHDGRIAYFDAYTRWLIRALRRR